MTRSRLALAAAVVVLAGAVVATVLYLLGDDTPADAAGVRITWASSEDGPTCAYDAATSTVRARLIVDGEAPEDQRLTVTVSAYADENTSDLVGSTTEVVDVEEGTVERTLTLTIPVERPSHRGEDGETACTLEVAER